MSHQIHRRCKPRFIRFQTLDDIRQDARRIVQAEHVEQLGNWSPGQAFEHLAKSFNSSIQESKAALPLVNRMIAKISKPLLLHFGLPRGVQIAPISEIAAREFLPKEHVSSIEGLKSLERIIDKLSTHVMDAKHNLFGKMSPKDWERMHCRHAELHLRLLVPINGSKA